MTRPKHDWPCPKGIWLSGARAVQFLVPYSNVSMEANGHAQIIAAHCDTLTLSRLITMARAAFPRLVSAPITMRLG